jgi:hypothetical protein
VAIKMEDPRCRSLYKKWRLSARLMHFESTSIHSRLHPIPCTYSCNNPY